MSQQQTLPTAETVKINSQQFRLHDFVGYNKIMQCLGCRMFLNVKTLDEAVEAASKHEETYHSEVVNEA